MTRAQLIFQILETNLGMGMILASQCPSCRKRVKESYYSNQKLGVCPHCQAKLPEGNSKNVMKNNFPFS